MRAVPLPYREFYYPLNVFMHILQHETEAAVPYLHYGLFTDPRDNMWTAQEHSTEMLRARLPPPPAKILDVGAGLGTTLAWLALDGYDMRGITPDEKQIAMIQRKYPLAVKCIRFEDHPAQPFDAIYFQESSQYIHDDALFAKCAEMTSHVIVLDEFSLRPVDFPGALHSLASFLEAATRHGFTLAEEVDLTEAAAPTIDYFNVRIPKYREMLIADIGITGEQVDELIASGFRYREMYGDGTYGYRLLQFKRSP
jgi:hypothetical protein